MKINIRHDVSKKGNIFIYNFNDGFMELDVIQNNTVLMTIYLKEDAFINMIKLISPDNEKLAGKIFLARRDGLFRFKIEQKFLHSKDFNFVERFNNKKLAEDIFLFHDNFYADVEELDSFLDGWIEDTKRLIKEEKDTFVQLLVDIEELIDNTLDDVIVSNLNIEDNINEGLKFDFDSGEINVMDLFKITKTDLNNAAELIDKHVSGYGSTIKNNLERTNKRYRQIENMYSKLNNCKDYTDQECLDLIREFRNTFAINYD